MYGLAGHASSDSRRRILLTLIFNSLARAREGIDGGWARALNESRKNTGCLSGLSEHVSGASGLAVDVGARGGAETMLARKLAGYSVVALECSHKAFVDIAERFRNDPNIELHYGCASDVAGPAPLAPTASLPTTPIPHESSPRHTWLAGQAQLHEAADSSSMHSRAVSQGKELQKAKHSKHRSTKVPTLVVDDLLKGKAARLCAVKVDTQGHELHVLMGMRRAIRRHKPVLYFEYSRKLLGEDFEKLLPWIKAKGYSCIPSTCESCNIMCLPIEAVRHSSSTSIALASSASSSSVSLAATTASATAYIAVSVLLYTRSLSYASSMRW